MYHEIPHPGRPVSDVYENCVYANNHMIDLITARKFAFSNFVQYKYYLNVVSDDHYQKLHEC